MARPRIATIWLDGCSGCHMSLLDLDEALAGVLGQVDLVYGPLVDAKAFPEGVDVTLVEGAVGSEEDEHRLREVRARTKVLIALGDCAVTGNVPAMRNTVGREAVLRRVYVENGSDGAPPPARGVPALRPRVCPVHEIVPVDLYLQGCPPPAAAIGEVVTALLAGRAPDLAGRGRFG